MSDYKDSDYTIMIAIMQMYHFCAETHFGSGVVSDFVFSSAAIAQLERSL